MNVNEFAVEVHENAKAHGWWDEDRPEAEVMALIHSEWSEALEEYRRDMPMHYKVCKNCGEPCVMYCCGDYLDTDCALGDLDPKPEGIAVELIDGCIRILDYLGKTETKIHEIVTLRKLMREVPQELLECDLPTLVARLHWYSSRAYVWGSTPFSERLVQEQMSFLYEALAMACAWIKKNGHDPEAIMREKHEYNKTRPYKHGNKKC